MNLNKISYFLALAQFGNYAEAAARTGIPEQALRMYIYNLTRKTGCELFEKQNGSLVLTPAGTCYHEHLKRIAGILDNTLKAIQLLNSKENLSRRVGITPSHGAGLAGRIIRRFGDRYPDERVELIATDPLNLRHMLQDGKLDLAFVNCPPPERLPFGIKAYPMFRREFLMAVPVSHRLAHEITDYDKLPVADISEFRDDSFILYDQGSYLDEIVRPLVESFPFSPVVAITTSSAIMVNALLEANYGVALSRFVPDQKLIRYFKLAEPIYSYYTVITRNGYVLSESDRYLCYLMTEAAGKESSIEVVESAFRRQLYEEFEEN